MPQGTKRGRAEEEDDGKGPTDTSKNGDDKENVVCVGLTKDEKDDDVVYVDRAEDPTFSGLFNRPRLRRRNRPYGLSDWDREQYLAEILLNGHYTEGV